MGDNRVIGTHLKKFFIAYILSAVVITFIVGWAVDLKARPDKDQRIGVFIGAESFDESKLNDIFTAVRPNYIKTVDLNFYLNTDAYFDMYLTIKGADSDIFILSEEKFSNANISVFLPIDTIVAQSLFGKRDLLYDGDVCYGIKIYDKDLKEGPLSDVIGFSLGETDRNYYILFNKMSRHARELNGSLYNGAVDMIKELLG